MKTILFKIGILFLLYLPFNLTAQTGAIIGSITEKSANKFVAGASVTLIGLNKMAISSDLGKFRFEQLNPGHYTIEISSIGFEKMLKDVVVLENQISYPQIRLENSNVELNEVIVTNDKSFDQQLIGKIDTKLRPINNAQEFLRMVPGLFIGQHAGGGKAEQIFLRGFDIDHGTDIQISSDGVPVNMVSHAHGQGYADLHFIIPELVSEVNLKKGMYDASKGDFATSGSVELNTKTSIDKSELKFETGQFNSYRGVAMLDLLGEKGHDKNQNAYLAGEYMYSDGYFENPQAFNRLNLFGKYHGIIGKNTQLTASASTFYSKWSASGQIPDRAVESGQIGFYGAIDPNEGGQTSRSNLNIQLISTPKSNTVLKNQFYFTDYHFKLISNFTFFLNDPVNGDQILQKEDRKVLGYNGSVQKYQSIFGKNISSTYGINLRNDATNGTELSHIKSNSELIDNTKLGNINETNAAVYTNQKLQITDKFNINAGLRIDYFYHQYKDQLLHNTLDASNSIVSPKLNFNYTFNNNTQVYLNTGKGFHTNDTRVVVAENGIKTLPAAYGSDLGFFFKPFKRLLINPAIWYLWLDQEFVYVGDEGVVEPSGRTRRYGLDFSARYQITNTLFFNLDFNTTKARSIDAEEGENYIPLAPVNTSSFALIYQNSKGITASITGRTMGKRAANEDDSIIANGYFINDASVSYSKSNYSVGLNIQNIFNVKWKETQFATESRLQNEAEPVTEIHFTPGTPFLAKINFSIKF